MIRRDLLLVGGAIAAAVALPPVLRRLPSEFEFEPISGFPGFRRIATGATSGGNALFLGLDDRLPDQAPLPEENPPNNPCLALFGSERWEEKKVPIAIFSDFNCPYCKVLEAHLIKLRDDGAPVQLFWHEMPLLGPSSLRSARAVVAAGYLGQADAGRRYLSQRPFPPGASAIQGLASALEVPPSMLEREIKSARVSEAISTSLQLGRLLGIPGTPGTVFGRTLVIGAIRPPDIKQLIDIELAEGPLICS